MIKPSYLSLEVSSYCNLKCKYCARQFMQRRPGNMPLGVAQKVRLQIGSLKDVLYHITFNCYGEPTLNPDLISIINLFADTNIRLILSTNCIIYNDELKDTHLSQLILHIDEPFSDRFNNAMKYINSDIPYIAVQYMVTDENEFDMEDFIVETIPFLTGRINVKVWVKYPILDPYRNINYCLTRDNFTRVLECVEIVGQLNQFRGSDKYCNQLSDLVVVLDDGQLMVGCCSPDPLWNIGNIDDGILDVFNSEYVNLLRLNFPNIDNCTECKKVTKQHEI